MQLVDMLKQSSAGELEVREGGRRFKLSKRASVMAAPVVPDVAEAESSADAAVPGDVSGVPANATIVKAHMVGLFHRGNGPGGTPIVSEGDSVSAGDVIGTIEALRNFTEVVCPVDGTIATIISEDGSPVQFGDPLIAIRPV